MIVIFDLSQMDFLLLSVILLYIVLSHCCYTIFVLMIDLLAILDNIIKFELELV